MAVEKYTALAQITLTSSASSVTFGSIPSGYRDLVLSCELIGSISEQYFLKLNGDSGSSYSWVQMGADSGGTFSSSTTTTGIRVGYFATTSARDNMQISIQDFSATDKHKSILVRTNSNAAATRAIAGRWASTSAVTSITMFFPSGSFNTGSTFKLFGVK